MGNCNRRIPRVKTCLMVLRTCREAGAERIILELAKGLKKSYRVEFAALSHRSESSEREIFGILRIIFGRYDLIHSHLFLPGVLIRLRRTFDRSFHWVHTVHYCSYDGQKAG